MANKGHVLIYLSVILKLALSQSDDPTNPHRDPSKCEVCKYVVDELEGSLSDTSKTHEVLRIGHEFDKEAKEIKYRHSETRLIDVLEQVCERILKYNIHAEREASRRFAKGTAETMQTLMNLRDKGVKVELGIPDNMWEVPGAPIYKMKQYCDSLIEQYEDVINDWYFAEPDERTDLTNLLCLDNYLAKGDQECLKEVWTGKERVDFDGDQEDEEKQEKKKKTGKKRKKNNTQDGEKKKKAKKGIHLNSENIHSTVHSKTEL
ncbi:protein canopy 4-like [Antedon mediterranea]|uniref:protein canopy 4-like n=1 Tax=Antedon mediterranea TaxID=105859 RepID=UPI003AF6A706